MTPLYVAADIHGHRSEFWEALREAGLVDTAGQWSGGGARLWLLGDYVDRGPDGIGVINDVQRLAVPHVRRVATSGPCWVTTRCSCSPRTGSAPHQCRLGRARRVPWWLGPVRRT